MNYQNYQVPPQPSYELSPELEKKKKHYFKKTSNHVAKAAILTILFQMIFSFVIMVILALIQMLPQAIEFAINNPNPDFAQIQLYVAQCLQDSPFFNGSGLTYLPTVFIVLAANLLPAFICAKKNRVNTKKLFAKTPVKPILIVIGCVISLGVNAIGGYIYVFLNEILSLFNLHATDSNLLPPTQSIIGAISFIVLICIIAPITEEFLFRGVLLKSLSKYGTFFACIVTSLIFGVIHGNFQQIPFAFLMGIVLSYFTIKTGSIRVSIIIHFVNNSFSVIFSYLFLIFPKQEVILNLLSFFIMTVCMITTIFVLVKYRRSIHFFKDTPPFDNSDNCIQIKKPYKTFFSSAGVIVFLVLTTILTAMTIIAI